MQMPTCYTVIPNTQGLLIPSLGKIRPQGPQIALSNLTVFPKLALHKKAMPQERIKSHAWSRSKENIR